MVDVTKESGAADKGVGTPDPSIEALNTEIQKLKAEAIAKDKSISELETEVSLLKEEVSVKDDQIESLKDQLSALTEEEDDQPEMDYEFVTPAFMHKGKSYKSAEIEKAVAEGDHDAKMLVLELIQVGQVVAVPKP